MKLKPIKTKGTVKRLSSMPTESKLCFDTGHSLDRGIAQ